MSVEEFEEIKSKVEKLKEDSLKAKGQQESILASWKNKGINSVEDAEKKIDELNSEIETKVARKEKMEQKLKELLGEQ